MKKILTIEGSHAPLMTQKELEAIVKILKDGHLDIKNIVELGCYAGGTTAVMAAARPDAQIYAIDSFVINHSEVNENTVGKFLERFPNVTVYPMSTNEAAQHYEIPESIDFLFIDADHQEHSIQEDCANWLQKVRPGGIVVFDDYHNDDFVAVKPNVDRATVGWEVIAEVDTICIKKKPEGDA